MKKAISGQPLAFSGQPSAISFRTVGLHSLIDSVGISTSDQMPDLEYAFMKPRKSDLMELTAES